MRIIMPKLTGPEFDAFILDARNFIRLKSRDSIAAQGLVRRISQISGPGGLRRFTQVKKHRELLQKLAAIAGYRFTYNLLMVEPGWHDFRNRRPLGPEELTDDDLSLWFDGLTEKGWDLHAAQRASELAAQRAALERRQQLKRNFTVELVPRGCWGRNLRSLLPEEGWEELRSRTAKAAGNVCEICCKRGQTWPVEVHEIWHYDDVRHVQQLRGLIALCPQCHRLKHWGRARRLEPIYELECVVLLAEYREMSREEARAYLAEQERIVRDRSRYSW